MNNELSYDACMEILTHQTTGRVALCTPSGPAILPVNYTVVEEAIVIRTTPYSVLGTHGWNTRLAFEVDRIDTEHQIGSSVVARGVARMIENRDELALIRTFHDPQPWAPGARYLYIKLLWDELTGRHVSAQLV